MITRIAAALFALYLVHGSENTARDGARLVGDLQREAPKAALSLCLDNAATCGALVGMTGHLAAPAEAGKTPPVTAGEPVEAGLYPLPPRRPGDFAKKA